MDGAVTGTLKVASPTASEVHQWNGNLDDRAAARAVFENLTRSGAYMASVVESPGRLAQVTTFEEIEAFEKAYGAVEVRMTPALAGG